MNVRAESGADFDLDSPAEWVGVGANSVFVATQRRCVSTIRTGRSNGPWSGWTARAMTSLTAPSGEQLLAMGYDDGVIEIRSESAAAGSPNWSLQGAPNSPVSLLMAGPPGAVIAGFKNGVVGLWDIRDGIRIRAIRLNGAVNHGVLKNQQFAAGTELGDTLAWDMAAFYTSTCALLQDVWQNVPVIWGRGQAVRQRPPSVHPCFPEEK